MTNYLFGHGRGWKYMRAVPKDLRKLLNNRRVWVKTFPGSVSYDEAKVQTRLLAVKHDRLIAGLRKFDDAGRAEIAAAGGWEAYRSLMERIDKLLPFGEFVARMEDEPGAADDPESAQAILEARRSVRDLRQVQTTVRQRLAKLEPTGDGIAALIPTWRRISGTRSAKVVQKMELYARRFINTVGAKPPHAIERHDIVAFRDAAERAYPRATAIKMLENIHALLNAAVKEGTLPFNPAHGVKVLVKADADAEKKPFQREHVCLIFDRMKADWNDDFQWVIRLCAYHGMRSGEACQLRPEDITTSMGVPVILVHGKHGSVKNRASRRDVPIHPKCKDIVKYAAKAKGPWLFASFPPWTQGRGAFFQKEANLWLRKIGVSDDRLTMHSLRHLWRRQAREIGMPDAVACAIGGWSFGKGEQAKYGGAGLSLRVMREWVGKIDPLT